MAEIIAIETGITFPIQSAEDFLETQRRTLDQILRIREENKQLQRDLKDTANTKDLQEQAKARENIVRQLAFNREALRGLAKDTRDARREFEASGEAGVTSYRAASQEANILRDTLKDLNFQGLGDTDEARAIEERFFELDTQLKKVDKRMGDFRRSVGDYRNEINGAVQDQQELVNQLVRLQTDFENLPVSVRRNEASIADFNTESARLRKEINELGKTTGATVADFKELNQPIDDLISKQKQLVQQIEKLEDEFNGLPKAVQENEKVIEAFARRSQELTEELRDVEEQTGIASDTFSKGFLDILSEAPGIAGQAASGVKGVGTALSKLAKNPIVGFVGLVVAGLTALVSAFTRTERGANLLAQATGVLEGLMSFFVGVVDNLADGLIAVYEDPVEGFKNLGQAILDNVINRFRGLIDLTLAVGEGIANLASGDLEGLRESAAKAGTAITQAFTGLDGEDQKELAEGIDELTKTAIANGAAFGELAAARRQVIRDNIELQKSIEALTTEEALLQITLSDSTLSFEELRAAQIALLEVSEERAAREVQIAQNNLKLLDIELSLRRQNGEDTLALEEQRIGAFQQLAAAERDLLTSAAENERERNQIRQDELEKDLDILRDGFNNRLGINLDSIRNERLTLEERQAIQEETTRLAQKTFDEQIAIFNELGSSTIDANELLASSDEETLRQRIRAAGLSEIVEQQLLDTYRDRLDIINDLKNSQDDLNDAQNEQTLSGIDAARDLAIRAAIIAGGTAEEIQDNISDITLQAQRERLEKELEIVKANSAEEAALKRELEETKLSIEQAANQRSLQQRLDIIRQQEAEAIRAARETTFSDDEVENERQRQARINEIKLEANKQAALAELEIAELSATERKQLEAEVAGFTVEQNNNKNQEIKTQEEQRIETIQNSINAVAAIIDTLGQASQARFDRETRAINERYDREVELANGNAESIEEINAEREAALEAAEREAFERNKRLQIANAIIAGARAVIGALALPPPFNTIQAAIIAATTAAQIGIIEATQFAQGGVIEAGTHASGNDAHYNVRGNRVALEGNEGVTNAKGMRSADVHTVTGTTSEINSYLNSIHGKKFKDKFIVRSGQFTVGEKAPPEPMFNVTGDLGRSEIRRIVNAQFPVTGPDIDYDRLSDLVTENMETAVNRIVANMPNEINLNKLSKELARMVKTKKNAQR